MKVDVIIPVFHPGERFRQLLSRLEVQSAPVNRIFVMNTVPENEKDTELLCGGMENYPSVEVISVPQEEFDHGGTRKRAVEYSDADIFVCMTQDALPADHRLIEKLLEALGRRDDIAAAYARQLPEDDCNVTERYTRRFNYGSVPLIKGGADLEQLGIKTYFCSNVCAAYRRDIYDEEGGFPEKTIFNEDMIYAARAVKAGYKIAYEPSARVVHSHNYSPLEQFKRNFDLGVSHAQYAEVFADVPAAKEGVKLVKHTAGWLLRKHPLMLPSFFIQSGAKFAGYQLGKRYGRLPGRLVLFCSMQKSYWK